jgi:hypothetical protein
MTKESNNNYACYQYSDKLKGQKWSKYSSYGMNSRLRRDYAKTLPLTGAKKGKISVPLGLHFETFADDVSAETNKNRGQKYLDASHLNASYLHLQLPPSSMQSFETKHYKTWSMMKLTHRLFLSFAGTNIRLNPPQITKSIQL